MGTRLGPVLAVASALVGCTVPGLPDDVSVASGTAPDRTNATAEAARWNRTGARARRAGDLESATRAHDRALEADPDSAVAYEGLGLVYLTRGNHALAEIALERAVEVDPERPESLAAMGALLDALERHTEARERYAQAIEVGGRTPGLLNDLGYSWYLEGDLTSATEAFEEALNLDPGFDRARANLALARFRAGDEEGALAAFRRIVGEHRALNNVGYLYLVAGDEASAHRLLTRSRDVAPRGYRRAERNLDLVGDSRRQDALELGAVRARLALTERSDEIDAQAVALLESSDVRDDVATASLTGGPLVPYDGAGAIAASPDGVRLPASAEASALETAEAREGVAEEIDRGSERTATLAKAAQGEPAPAPIDPTDDEPIERLGPELVRSVQQALNERGMQAGPADGAPGARTVRALRRFKIARRLPVTDDITPRLLDELGVERR